MKSAREEFGPPMQGVQQRVEQKMKDLQTVRDLGQQLKQAGVTQDAKPQPNVTLVKNNPTDHSAHKDKGVKQGDRHALTPCDGKVQATGQALKNNGVTKSAAQKFSGPAKTPSAPTRSAGGRSH